LTVVIDKQIDYAGGDAYTSQDYTSPCFGETILRIGWSPICGKCRGFGRFTGISGLSGVIITAAWIELNMCGNFMGSPHYKVSAQDAESPPQINHYHEHQEAPRTSAFVDWHLEPGSLGWRKSPSLIPVIQELADKYNPSAITVLIDPEFTDVENTADWFAYEYGGHNRGMKLHIEYVPVGSDIETRNAKIVDLGGGRYSIDAFMSPVQMRVGGGEWQDIKPKLVRDKDGWHVEGAPYYAEVKDNGERLFRPNKYDGAKYLRLPSVPLVANTSKNVINEPTLLDGEVLPNRVRMTETWGHIDYIFTTTALKFVAVFDTDPQMDKITFDVDTAGMDITSLLASKSGLGIPKPRLIDNKGQVRELEWQELSGKIELNLDFTGLNFPVTLKNTTIDKQVGASLDDVDEIEDDGTITNNAFSVNNISGDSAANRRWGGYRWTGISIAQSATIDVCYMQGKPSSAVYDDPNFNIHFEKAAAGAQFTTDAYSVTGKTRTNASVAWVANGIGNDFVSSPSLVTPMQELVNAYAITALVAITRPNQDVLKNCFFRCYEYDDNSHGAKIHIEYSTGGTTHYGAATLAGAGTLAGIGRLLLTGKATLSGAGNLSAIGYILGEAVYGAATLAGTGALSVIGGLLHTAKATISGTGALATAASLTLLGKATLAGVGSISAIAYMIRAAKVTLTGVGTLSVKGSGGAVGRVLKVAVITSQHRTVSVITSQYRKIKSITGG